MTVPTPSLGSLTPFAARFTGVAAITGGALLLLSTVAFVTVGGGVNDGVLGGTITVWAVFALAVAFVGICRLLEPARPRLAQWLTLVAVIGFVAGGGFGLQAIHLEAFGDGGYLDDEAAIEAAPIGLLAYLPWGWFTPLTFVLAGVVLWRAGVVPWWNGTLLILGGILFISARPARIDALAILTDVVLLAALTAVAVRLFAAARSAGVSDLDPASRTSKEMGSLGVDTPLG